MRPQTQAASALPQCALPVPDPAVGGLDLDLDPVDARATEHGWLRKPLKAHQSPTEAATADDGLRVLDPEWPVRADELRGSGWARDAPASVC